MSLFHFFFLWTKKVYIYCNIKYAWICYFGFLINYSLICFLIYLVLLTCSKIYQSQTLCKIVQLFPARYLLKRVLCAERVILRPVQPKLCIKTWKEDLLLRLGLNRKKREKRKSIKEQNLSILVSIWVCVNTMWGTLCETKKNKKTTQSLFKI